MTETNVPNAEIEGKPGHEYDVWLENLENRLLDLEHPDLSNSKHRHLEMSDEMLAHLWCLHTSGVLDDFML